MIRSISGSRVAAREIMGLQAYLRGRIPTPLMDLLARISEGLRYGHTITVVVGEDLTTELTSAEALESFREAWEAADAEGDTGNRVRRGMAAAIERARVSS